MRTALLISFLSYLLPIAKLSQPLINIDCNFQKSNTYHAIKHAYECQVMNILNITSFDSTAVDVPKGKHHVDMTNDDVVAFSSINKTTLYFPRGLEKFFKNLQAIYLEHGRLKEVHQGDFKAYTNLTALYLGNNDIEVLEDGLFDFNVNLEFASFWGSKIVHIDEGAFKNSVKLSHLWLNYNKCSTKWVSDDLDEIKVLIKELGLTCTDIEYSQISESLRKLEKSLKTLSHENYQDFSDKFKVFGKNFQSSNFSYFLTFKDRFEGITNDPNYRESNDYLKFKNKIETVKFNHKGSKGNCENVCYADVNKFTEDVVDTFKSTFNSFSALSQKVGSFGGKIGNSNLKMTDNLKKIEELQDEVEAIKHNLEILVNSTKIDYFEVITPKVYEHRIGSTPTPTSPYDTTQIDPSTPKTYDVRPQNLESKVIKSQSESNLNQTRKGSQKRPKSCESRACPTDEDNSFKIEVRKSIEELKNDTQSFEDEMTEKVDDLTKKVEHLTEKNEELTKNNEELTIKIEELIKENEKWKVDNEYFTSKIGKYDKELEFLKKSLNELSQKI